MIEPLCNDRASTMHARFGGQERGELQEVLFHYMVMVYSMHICDSNHEIPQTQQV